MRKLTLALLLPFAFAACGGSATGAQEPTGPEGIACEGDLCVLTGTLTDDLTLTADKSWLLRGGVFIGDDTTETVLTIEAGTTIYGESSTLGMLVIRRGSRLVAEGTAQAPIVFTSSKDAGSRARGDWGGLILNGRAHVNGCGEAMCEGFGEGGTGFYGGDDDSDDSGVLRYVRVEFAGSLLSPDNELNGIAFQGVGSGTVVDYVQVHMNADDGIEFFGGAVDVRHLLVTGAADDMFDWTDGWRGRAQFLLGQQYDDASDNGIEADNNAEQNESTPRSAPVLSNVTLIGSPASLASDVGMLLREGTAVELHNVLVMGFNEACLDIDDTSTFSQADAGDLVIANSILDCTAAFVEDADEPATVESIFTAGDDNSLTDAELAAPYSASTPGFAPSPGSAAQSGAVVPSDSFFTQVTFLGAVDPAADWTAGWTTSDRN